MINDYDKSMMERDIGDIITQWAYPVVIRIPVADESQPGWNPLMREVNGDILYMDTPVDAGIEMDKWTLSTEIAGDNMKRIATIHIPSSAVRDIDTECRILMDEVTWRVVRHVRIIGEIIADILAL
jgi:hypothetical protein